MQDREDGVDEMLNGYGAFINARPQLLSILYDIDMLPEQCRTRVGAIRLVAFCEVWKKLPDSYQTNGPGLAPPPAEG